MSNPPNHAPTILSERSASYGDDTDSLSSAGSAEGYAQRMPARSLRGPTTQATYPGPPPIPTSQAIPGPMPVSALSQTWQMAQRHLPPIHSPRSGRPRSRTLEGPGIRTSPEELYGTGSISNGDGYGRNARARTISPVNLPRDYIPTSTDPLSGEEARSHRHRHSSRPQRTDAHDLLRSVLHHGHHDPQTTVPYAQGAPYEQHLIPQNEHAHHQHHHDTSGRHRAASDLRPRERSASLRPVYERRRSRSYDDRDPRMSRSRPNPGYGQGYPPSQMLPQPQLQAQLQPYGANFQHPTAGYGGEYSTQMPQNQVSHYVSGNHHTSAGGVYSSGQPMLMNTVDARGRQTHPGFFARLREFGLGGCGNSAATPKATNPVFYVSKPHRRHHRVRRDSHSR